MDGLVLRDIQLYGPGRHEFHPGAYPWLAALGVLVKAGDGGRGADGTPGRRGENAYQLIPVGDLGPVLRIDVGRGRPGTGGGRGQDGMVVLELYAGPEVSGEVAEQVAAGGVR